MAKIETTTEKYFRLFGDAYESAIIGKSYTINTGGSSRTFTRQDLPFLKTELLYWEKGRSLDPSGETP